MTERKTFDEARAELRAAFIDLGRTMAEELPRPLRALFDRARQREFIRTNDLGASDSFAIGTIQRGIKPGVWRVTAHRWVPTMPWETVIVYAVPVSNAVAGRSKPAVGGDKEQRK